MTSKERVMTVLNHGQPDRVPFMEVGIDTEIKDEIMKRNEYTPVEFADTLGIDCIGYIGFKPPIFADKKIIGGKEHILEGHITSRDKLDLIKLPELNDSFYEPAYEFIDNNKSDYPLFAQVRLGISSTLLSMGIPGFSIALYEDPDLIEEVLKRYTDWSAEILSKVKDIGFDFVWATDDIAYETGTFFSPAVFKNYILSHLIKVAKVIDVPWIYHSDGNLSGVVDDIIYNLKPNALHPIDPKGMNLKETKKKYGKDITLIGNIDLNYTLTRGTPDEVEDEVRQRIKDAGEGGAYAVSSANSITSYCKKENVLAMSKAIKKYGKYPIDV